MKKVFQSFLSLLFGLFISIYSLYQLLLQSAKILLLPSKCEIIFVTLYNDNFSNIAIAILDFSLLLPI